MSEHEWISIANLSLTVKGKSRVLQIVISPDIWTVLALERSCEVFEHNTPADGIGDHKHVMIGEYDGPLEAIQQAERFADEWKKTETLDAAVCACALS